ncbi:MAG TPA: ABC transporter permease [Fimbriiglobus sp.]|jgi:ABC-type transport system involved in multi-copper enzyme maturation permease subunit
MLSSITNSSVLFTSFVLVLVQAIAALPWLNVLIPGGLTKHVKIPKSLAIAAGSLIVGTILAAVYTAYKGQSEGLIANGRYYAAILHVQLIVDYCLLAPALLTLVWPKGGAVAQAAFREGCRQPMFWLLTGFAGLMLYVSVWIPYFTFGDDYKMMKQIGYDMIMLASALFGVLAASMSISEEIEGRTAITLLSKPINRRQFLIGKFVGILMTCLLMSLILGWNFNWALREMADFDPINKTDDPLPLQAKATFVQPLQHVFTSPAGKGIAEGIGMWTADSVANSFGVILGIGQVMILVAIASALATRLPFVVNLIVCLVLYFLGHLAPVVVKVTEQTHGGGAGKGLVRFLGQLFDTLLPALEFFNMGPAVIREIPLDLWQFGWYVLTVLGYSIIYTVIALLVGLLLFEDRDLA